MLPPSNEESTGALVPKLAVAARVYLLLGEGSHLDAIRLGLDIGQPRDGLIHGSVRNIFLMDRSFVMQEG